MLPITAVTLGLLVALWGAHRDKTELVAMGTALIVLADCVVG